MTEIIRLQERRHQAPQPTSSATGGATILLFTGVRYERLEPPTRRPGPGSKPPKAKSTKRG